MKRITMLLAAIAVTAVSAVAAQAASGPTVKLANTNKGKILTNGRGFTLYEFSRDTPGKDNCVSISGCLQVWPPVTTSGKIKAGKGVKRSLLGKITLPNGRKQVTYAGHPLYTYVADGGPGETSYIGVFQSGGRWYALNASGHLVKKHH